MFLIPTLVISSCASFDESGASPQPDESTCDADLWVDRSPLRRLSGGQHALTGAPHLVGDEDVSSLPWKGMSVDQVIADRVMVPGRFRSLHIKNRGRVASNSSDDDNFCRYAGAAVPIESDLERLWERLFPSTESESTLEGELIAGRSTVLDSLDTHYGDSLDRVAPADELKR